jgi:hypothetical protein
VIPESLTIENLLDLYRTSMEVVPKGGSGVPIVQFGKDGEHNIGEIDPGGMSIQDWLPIFLDQVKPDWIGVTADAVFSTREVENIEQAREEHVPGLPPLLWEEGDTHVQEALVSLTASPDGIFTGVQPYHWDEEKRVWEEPYLSEEGDPMPGGVTDILLAYYGLSDEAFEQFLPDIGVTFREEGT